MTKGISKSDLGKVFAPDLVLAVEKAAQARGMTVRDFVSDVMRPIVNSILFPLPDPTATQPEDPNFYSAHITM